MDRRRNVFGRAGVLALLAVCAGARAERVADLSRDGVTLTVDAEPAAVDLARDFYVTVTLTADAKDEARLPDLRERDRFQGFKVAEDFTEEPLTDAEGKTTTVSRWRLEPDPCAAKYRLAPFVVTTAGGAFYTRPVVFAPPEAAAREGSPEAMEVAPTRDLPPLSWKLAGWCAGALAGAALLLAGVWVLVRKLRQMVRVRRMSPIERALYELGRLLEKGLPGRGFYKDFYVELTMVVRRYIERQHGVRAPHLTTDEFLRAAQGSAAFTAEAVADLRQFLESADLVKFAGVEATPEMADGATAKARTYLESDSRKERAK